MPHLVHPRPEAQELIDDVTRLARATHALHWMSQDVALRLLHAPAGLDALARQGLLTPEEARRIEQSEGPINPRWQMPLAWLVARVAAARERGLLSGGDALHLAYHKHYYALGEHYNSAVPI